MSQTDCGHKFVTNWITSAAARDGTLYVGDNSGRLTQTDFSDINNERKVRHKDEMLCVLPSRLVLGDCVNYLDRQFLILFQHQSHRLL